MRNNENKQDPFCQIFKVHNKKKGFIIIKYEVLEMIEKGMLKSLDFVLYSFILNRYNITNINTKKKNFIDENGEKYCIFTREQMLKVVHSKRPQDITESIKRLEKFNLIKVARANGKATKFYITN